MNALEILVDIVEIIVGGITQVATGIGCSLYQFRD